MKEWKRCWNEWINERKNELLGQHWFVSEKNAAERQASWLMNGNELINLASVKWSEWNAAPSSSRAARQAKGATNNSSINCGWAWKASNWLDWVLPTRREFVWFVFVDFGWVMSAAALHGSAQKKTSQTTNQTQFLFQFILSSQTTQTTPIHQMNQIERFIWLDLVCLFFSSLLWVMAGGPLRSWTSFQTIQSLFSIPSALVWINQWRENECIDLICLLLIEGREKKRENWMTLGGIAGLPAHNQLRVN